ncbi:MAG TPA: PIN domain-containing protein [Vicinamibacterales bacterium]|nr:PIN domain-containing protein [Vicinamibacterales bacterium]
MTVLVDTPIWSAAFRRRAVLDAPPVSTLRRLIEDGRAALVGPIRQELLSGIRDAAQFERLKDRLAAFPDEPIERQDYERAAEYFNACRRRGIQGSNTDFLLCAVAQRQAMPIFTDDDDFGRYSRVLDVPLFAR